MKTASLLFTLAVLPFLSACTNTPQDSSQGSTQGSTTSQGKSIVPKAVWNDTDGKMIDAHGGGFLCHDGIYYWYGEAKQRPTTLPDSATWERYRVDVIGVSCYSSRDLVTWKNEGIVLPAVPNDTASDLHPSKVLERPKVIYNAKTKKFVMWFHAESADYSKACAGVAVSDSPTGPFEYLGSFRPNDSMSRDQTLFVDDDGTAYQFASSEHNKTLHINRLTPDYLKCDGTFTRTFIGWSREAPAVFKHDGKYYMLTSGCTGWDPNEADLAVADSILGDWTMTGNPCVGPDADKTFGGQSTYVLNTPAGLIACFDVWNKHNLGDSRYVWLPLVANSDTTVAPTAFIIPWRDSWSFSDLAK
ncbi:MAG: family 43 glycosylhydrolase [Bacteroidales bacterium]|nr:family 43 glycosylhydrolase [Bacteroidales bacterium]